MWHSEKLQSCHGMTSTWSWQLEQPFYVRICFVFPDFSMQKPEGHWRTQVGNPRKACILWQSYVPNSWASTLQASGLEHDSPTPWIKLPLSPGWLGPMDGHERQVHGGCNRHILSHTRALSVASRCSKYNNMLNYIYNSNIYLLLFPYLQVTSSRDGLAPARRMCFNAARKAAPSAIQSSHGQVTQTVAIWGDKHFWPNLSTNILTVYSTNSPGHSANCLERRWTPCSAFCLQKRNTSTCAWQEARFFLPTAGRLPKAVRMPCKEWAPWPTQVSLLAASCKSIGKGSWVLQVSLSAFRNVRLHLCALTLNEQMCSGPNQPLNQGPKVIFRTQTNKKGCGSEYLWTLTSSL